MEYTSLTPRKKLEILYGQLKDQRAHWEPHWRDLGENFLPRAGRWAGSQWNKKDRRNRKLVDSTPRMAARTLASGMMAGLTSPARPWFRLTTPDIEMMEYGPVKVWLYQVEMLMRDVFSKSNLYNVLPKLYEELGVFGTGAMAALADPDKIVRFYPFTINSYWIALDDRLIPNTFARELTMTAWQMANMFDKDRLSMPVKSALANGNYQLPFEVYQFVVPNENRNAQYDNAANMPVSSIYIDKAGMGETKRGDEFLLTEGFHEHPVLVARWDVTAEDVYGTSPAMDCLGDARAIQLQQRRKAQAIDKLVDPPMWGHPSLRNDRQSLLPGDTTYSEPVGNSPGYQPVYQIRPDVNSLLQDIYDTSKRINQVMYTDLFLMLSQSDRREITAREVDERHEEKLLMLGPILERLNDELLDPLIDRVFSIMLRKGLIPEAPPELEGVDLKVEYISILAQAQRAVATAGIEKLAAFSAGIAAIQPEIMDKVDTDQMIDEYANAVGVAPTVVVPDDVVAQKRAARQQQQQAAQMAESMPDIAKSLKMMGETQTGGDTLLARAGEAIAGGG